MLLGKDLRPLASVSVYHFYTLAYDIGHEDDSSRDILTVSMMRAVARGHTTLLRYAYFRLC